MGKDGSIKAMNEIKKGNKLNKGSTYYRMNFLDKHYKAKSPGKLVELITFQKRKRQARVEVYDNCICFDVRELGKDETYHNVDWNDEEIIERVKLTKWGKLNPLGAVSFVMGLGYQFIEDKFYDDIEEVIEENNGLKQYEVQGAIQQSLF